jgi:hypothetical protein
MSYSVDWTPAARATLATIWIGAADRQAVTNAQARMDRLLAVDPVRNGTWVSEGLYAVEVHPLRALFEVAATGRFVSIVSVSELA